MKFSLFSILLFVSAASLAQSPDPVVPPDMPTTPTEPNAVTNTVNVTTGLRVTDPVKAEASAVRILTTKDKLTTAEAKKFLRPEGELDIQRCVEVIVLARLAVETDGFRRLSAIVQRLPADVAAVDPVAP